MSLQCPRCDAPLDGSARFCSACGSEVPSPAVTAPAAAPTAGSSPSPSSTAERFSSGQLLGERYRIVQRLGRGGMGEVYRADDLELGQSVALKFLPERLTADGRALDRLRSEVRLARTVSHTNVCRVYDLGQSDGQAFISMEYIDGEDLADALRRMGRPSREKAAELARQICAGLAAAHEAGVLHRDLKPANIMIDGRGRARITDFGLARLNDELEDTSEFAGTPAYMAPEQLSEGRVSVQSDIYSLGLVLYELFTGRRFIEGDSVEEVRARHASGSSSPSSFADLAPSVERALERCLEPNPGARPRSVYEVLAALPGGDPLAAALAAGETPSPELVASARGSGAIRPPAVALLVLWVVGSLIAVAEVNKRTVAFPQRSTSELAFLAKDIVTRDLGWSGLPPHDSTAVMRNPKHDEPGQRPYLVWRRWSPAPLAASDFHNPRVILLNDPPHVVPGSIAVVLDDTGALVELSVIGEPHPDDGPVEADPEALLARARIDRETVTAQSVDPAALDPRLPVRCDRGIVWHDKESGEPVARAGMDAGRIVSFQHLGHDPGWAAVPEFTRAQILYRGIRSSALLVMIVLVVRNLRLGRVDLRGTLRTATVVLLAYLTIELVHFDLGGNIVYQLTGLVHDRAGGHAFLHAVQIGIIYLAFEPIARRAWPRVLVGWVRLLDGRLGDPRVGFEVLIGLAGGSLFVLVWTFVLRLGFGETSVLEDGALEFLRGPAATTTFALSSIAVGLFRTLFAVACIGIGYVVTRHPRRGLAVGGIVVALMYYGIGLNWGWEYGPAVVYGVAHGVLISIVFIRGGFVALASFMVLTYFLRGLALSSDLTAWYAPYSVVTFLAVLLVLAHAAWAALAGREGRS